jgi:hypothetical protein
LFPRPIKTVYISCCHRREGELSCALRRSFSLPNPVADQVAIFLLHRAGDSIKGHSTGLGQQNIHIGILWICIFLNGCGCWRIPDPDPNPIP